MKIKNILLTGAALVALPSTSLATFVLGYNSFSAGGATEAPDYVMDNNGTLSPVFASTSVSKPLNQVTGVAVGGSDDNVYGNGSYGFGVANLPSAGANNGYLQIQKTSGSNPIANFAFTNASAVDLWLKNILFDAIKLSTGSPVMNLKYSLLDGLVTTTGNLAVPIAPNPPAGANPGDWQDYQIATSIRVPTGAALTVQFEGQTGALNGIGLDNIAFVVIPEPGNVLALCGLLGSAALIRRRRGVSASKATAALVPAV